MVKKIVAALIWIVVALEAIVFFLPKKELYYLAERYMEQIGAFVSGEDASDYGWALSLKGGTLYYDRTAIAENARTTLITTIFYNELSVDSFELSDTLAAIAPARVDFLKARHTIFAPHKFFLSAEGAIGAATGWIDLFDRKIYLLINVPSETQQKYGQIFARLEKTSEGFVYERDF
ncbi:MAG: hypothetical protein LBF86_01300 [Helicobacteraceae bacterium]|nr:hypothetical protein [Helicobacteraceae bacterium]